MNDMYIGISRTWLVEPGNPIAPDRAARWFSARPDRRCDCGTARRAFAATPQPPRDTRRARSRLECAAPRPFPERGTDNALPAADRAPTDPTGETQSPHAG